jgi:hypothetical protein
MTGSFAKEATIALVKSPLADSPIRTSADRKRLALGEAPADIDHLHVVAADRCRHGERGASRLVACAAVVEIDAQHADDTGEVGVIEDLGRLLLPFVVDESAARRRGADVSHQIHVGTVRR